MDEATEKQEQETAGTVTKEVKVKTPTISCQIDLELDARIQNVREKKQNELGLSLTKSQVVVLILREGCSKLGVA